MREQSDPTPAAEAVAVVDLAELADLADPFEAGELVDLAPARTVPDPDELREHIARLVREQDTYRRGLLAIGTRPVDDDLWCKRDEQIRRLQAKLPPATLLPPSPSPAVAATATARRLPEGPRGSALSGSGRPSPPPNPAARLSPARRAFFMPAGSLSGSFVSRWSQSVLHGPRRDMGAIPGPERP
jgi:hypothetical protein